jgi:hypothetical protein
MFAALATLADHHDPMSQPKQQASFKGDADGHLEKLIAASQPRAAAAAAPAAGRALVPYFDGGGAASPGEALQGRPAHAGLKRGAGERSSAQLAADSVPATAAAAAPKARRRGGKKGAAAAAAAAAAERPPQQPAKAAAKGGKKDAAAGNSNSGNSGPTAADRARHMAKSQSFAGPAFSVSPMPDSLPIPTSSLLAAATAAHHRAA